MIDLRLIILIAFLPIQINAQFAPELVATFHGNANTEKTLYHSHNLFVALQQGELHSMTIENSGEFVFERFENSMIALTNFNFYDFDLDGDLDVIAHNRTQGGLHVYEYDNGGFTFRPEGFSQFSGTVRAIHAQDFNNDGLQDLWINRSVYLTTGPGEVEQGIKLTASNLYDYDFMHFQDLNDDGNTDVLSQRGNRMWGYLDDGDAFFTTISPDFRMEWMTVIDAAGTEQILYHDESGAVHAAFFDNGAFSSKQITNDDLVLGDRSPLHVDIDADGIEEIVLNWGRDFYILKYHPEDTSMTIFTQELEEWASTMTAFHVDDSVKLAIVYADGYSQYTLEQNMQAVLDFRQVEGFDFDHFTDVDGDGNTDIVDEGDIHTPIRIRRYLGDRTFAPLVATNLTGNRGEFDDWDTDGDLDYVVEDGWYENMGNLVFGDFVERDPDTLPYPEPQILFTKQILHDDLDGDGDIDIVSYNFFGEPVEIHENVDNLYFNSGVVIGTSASISGDLLHVEALDLDQDGDKDLLLSAASGTVWFENSGGLNYPTIHDLGSGVDRPFSLDIEDVNSDGFPDLLIATTHSFGGSVDGLTKYYHGSADGPVFVEHTGWREGAHRAAFGKIDADSIPDVVFVCEEGLYWVHVSESGFADYVYIDGGFGINNKIVVKDLDSDGDIDILTHCFSCFAPMPNQNNRVSFYLNGGMEADSTGICPPGDVYLATTEHVSDYAVKYAGCPVIPGDLFIGSVTTETSFTDLAGLRGLQRVNGTLQLHDVDQIQSLRGLEQLTYIGEDLLIESYNGAHLGGLQALDTIMGNLVVSSSFTDDGDASPFDSLVQLAHLGGDISISNCRFPDLHSLSSQSAYYGNITLRGNRLRSVGFLEHANEIQGQLLLESTGIDSLQFSESMTTLGGLTVVNNQNLREMAGMPALTRVGGDVRVQYNPYLPRLPRPNTIEHIAGDFYVDIPDVSNFTSLRHAGSVVIVRALKIEQGLSQLESVDRDFRITALMTADFAGVNKLTEVPGLLQVLTTELTDLSPFSSITHVGEFRLSSNDELTNLAGLNSNLVVDSTWYIERNDNLAFCNFEPLCAHIDAGKPVVIQDNAPGCADSTEISCTVAARDLTPPEWFSVAPVPADQYVIFKLDSGTYQLSMIDQLGRTVLTRKIVDGDQVSTTHLAEGTYALMIASLDDFKETYTSKVIIVR